MTFEAGSLVVVPFPFSDLTGTKRRPVVLMTPPDGYGDFIAMAVTSQGGHAASIAILPNLIESGTLPKASWIRTDKIVSLNQSLIIKTVAKIDETLRLQAARYLCVKLQENYQ